MSQTETGGPPCIELRDVGKIFSRKKKTLNVLSGVSLSISAGEFVCLLGPSGCGKSTILGLLAGFEGPTEGAVLLDGKPVQGPGPDRGMVFQQPTLFPWLSVIENVNFGPRMRGVPEKIRKEEAEKYLDLVGLKGFEHYMPWQLSGGMRQRVALARSWISNPRILLMDEPFASLDAQTRILMQELLNKIREQSCTTILFVTHDVDEAIFLADRILIMSSRPAAIVEDLTVNWQRPRDIENLAADAETAELRRRVLRRVRDEVRKTMWSNYAI
jgi:NitT/TauT family transport system ATP-binding protein